MGCIQKIWKSNGGFDGKIYVYNVKQDLNEISGVYVDKPDPQNADENDIAVAAHKARVASGKTVVERKEEL